MRARARYAGIHQPHTSNCIGAHNQRCPHGQGVFPCAVYQPTRSQWSESTRQPRSHGNHTVYAAQAVAVKHICSFGRDHNPPTAFRQAKTRDKRDNNPRSIGRRHPQQKENADHLADDGHCKCDLRPMKSAIHPRPRRPAKLTKFTKPTTPAAAFATTPTLTSSAIK